MPFLRFRVRFLLTKNGFLNGEKKAIRRGEIPLEEP